MITREDLEIAPEKYAVHFGVRPEDHDGDVAMVDGHDSPQQWHQILPSLTVDGSWQCWGSDDPDCADDHDDTLHVVFEPEPDVDLAIQIDWARERVYNHLGVGSRLLDYALVTTAVWSEPVAVYTADNRFFYHQES